MKRFALLSCLAVFTCACSLYQLDSEMTTFNYHPAKISKDEVAYLENVNRPYEVIGRITVNAERNQKMNNIMDKLKYEAAVLGGDAITNLQTNAGTGKWARIKPKKLFGNANIRTNFIADVIVFTDTTRNEQGKL